MFGRKVFVEAELVGRSCGVEPRVRAVSWLKKQAVTIGPWVLIPESWTETQALSVLRHEIAGHVRQYSWFGFGNPIVGIPGFLLVYGLLLLPVGGAICRVLLELHAVKQRWRQYGEWYGHRDWEHAMVLSTERWAHKLWSSMYLWAAPKFLTRWLLNRQRKALLKEELCK